MFALDAPILTFYVPKMCVVIRQSRASCAFALYSRHQQTVFFERWIKLMVILGESD